jgi:polar amino acid transport system substrate-binding protein
MLARLLKASLAVLALGVTLAGGALAAGGAPGAETKRSTDPGCLLRVAWEPYDPYTFVNSDGILTGADIELIKAVAQEIGCELSFRGMPWNRILLEIQKGAVDVTSSASWTEERNEWAWFSAPYRKPEVALFVRDGESRKHQLTSLAEIPRAGFRLGLIEGYFLGDEVASLMADPAFAILVEGAADYAVNLTKLLHGRIDGFLVDDVLVLHAEARALGVLDAVERHPLQIEGVNLHYMFSRQSVPRDIVEAFDQALARMRAEGELDRIFQEFLKNSDG